MEIISSAEFWASVNIALTLEIVGLFASCFAVGYGVGYTFYMTRRLAHSST